MDWSTSSETIEVLEFAENSGVGEKQEDDEGTVADSAAANSLLLDDILEAFKQCCCDAGEKFYISVLNRAPPWKTDWAPQKPALAYPASDAGREIQLTTLEERELRFKDAIRQQE